MSTSVDAHEMYACIERLRISLHIGRAHYSDQSQYSAISETVWIREPAKDEGRRLKHSAIQSSKK